MELYNRLVKFLTPKAVVVESEAKEEIIKPKNVDNEIIYKSDIEEKPEEKEDIKEEDSEEKNNDDKIDVIKEIKNVKSIIYENEVESIGSVKDIEPEVLESDEESVNNGNIENLVQE